MESIRSIANQIIEIVKQSWFSPLINTLSIFLLAWTAIEAFRSRRAEVEANNLKLAPLFAIYLHSPRNSNEYFSIKNIGDGVAYDVKIDNWTLIFQDVHEIMDFFMTIPGTNIFAKNDVKNIDTKVVINGRPSSLPTNSHTAYIRHFNTTGIQIRFRDAIGRECGCLIKISNNQVDIIKPTYRINSLTAFEIWYALNIRRNIKICIEKTLWRYEKKSINNTPNYLIRISRIFTQELKKAISFISN